MSYHLFSSTERKAAKQHRCIWCGEAINQGERYFDERAVYYGEMQRSRWHPECLQTASDGMNSGEFDEFCPYDNERPEKEAPCPHP